MNLKLKRAIKVTWPKPANHLMYLMPCHLPSIQDRLFIYASTAKSRTWRAIFLILERAGPGIL
jgi:hypothetical protein